MHADMGDLIVLVVIGLIAAIGVLVKSFREARTRDERLRQLHPRPERDALAPPSRPEAPSPLQQFRDFMEQVQAESRRRQPAAPPLPHQPVVRQVRRVVQPPQAVRIQSEEPVRTQPVRGKLVDHLAQGDVKTATATAMAREEHGEPVSHLASIVGSERSDLEKAIILSEILGRPVALRRPVVPRLRS